MMQNSMICLKWEHLMLYYNTETLIVIRRSYLKHNSSKRNPLYSVHIRYHYTDRTKCSRFGVRLISFHLI